MLGQNKTTKCKPSALDVSSIKVLVSVSVAFGNCWNKLVTRS